jgi:type II secretory pathway component PulJ
MVPEIPAEGSLDAQVVNELAQSWPTETAPSVDTSSPEAAAEGIQTQPTDNEPQEDFEKILPTDSQEVVDFKKSLQKGFSRKMNALQKKLAEIEAKGGQSGEEAKKAQAFELLMQSEDPVAAVTALKKLQGNPQAQAQNSLQRIVQSVPNQLKEAYKPEHLESLTGLMMHVIREGLLPELRPYQQFLDNMARTQATQEVDTITKKYPTASKYHDKATAIAREKGLTYEQALLVASNGQVLLEQQRHAQEEKRANGTQTRIPATSPRQTVPISNGNAPSDDEIAAELFEIDKRSGSNRYFANRFFKG